MKKILLILTSVITLSSQTMAYEEANYEVVKENRNYEIRKYSDRLVIETNSIQGNGFRKLFNYISGNNEKNFINFNFSNNFKLSNYGIRRSKLRGSKRK